MTTKDSKDRKYAILAMKIAGDFGATLAVPVVLLVLLAQWLQGRYDFGIWIIILAFAVAALISGNSIFKKAKYYSKRYQDIEKEEIRNSEIKK